MRVQLHFRAKEAGHVVPDSSRLGPPAAAAAASSSGDSAPAPMDVVGADVVGPAGAGSSSGADGDISE
eukprot:5582022-Lingulodinium_polyedra.AAC.1